MFQTMTVGQKFSKEEFKKLEEELRFKLFQLQSQCTEHKIAVLVTIMGVECAGRGSLINTLSSWLDAKKLHNNTFWLRTDEEIERPDTWRYWRKIPGYGEFGIFFGGWYEGPVDRRAKGQISESELCETLHKRMELERTLADNGYVISKFWLHLSEKEYNKRHKARQKEQGRISFTPKDKDTTKTYASLIDTMATTITVTDRDFAPWFSIDAYDKEFKVVSVARVLIQNLENAIADKIAAKAQKKAEEQTQQEACITILDRVDLRKTLERNDYRAQLKALKNEVYSLTFEAYKRGISSTLVFEGWDAGGKGGAIRRIAGSVDARISRIIPISAPTDEELAHHYLWRFWRHVPRAGHVTMYDRSWYGRVLVERVEGFAKQHEWKRAFAEINNFEEQLTDGKNILLKFWLHISAEEQLRRFEERANTPYKNYKITDEDWRNREKGPAYKIAADEMFMRTDTAYAPWKIIPAESKYFARIEVLKCYRDALNKALDKNSKEVSKKDPALLSVKQTLDSKKKNTK